ncbi:hypothetical protein [Streptomyces umbrinus]|uniref:hypothetical protein n=1 Tax=Streptomyces umbrinus TaxID=67370 RepID=UPI003426E3A2
MTATVEAIQRELTAHLRSRTEWDEQPALFTLHRADGEAVRLVRVPIPDDVWTTIGHPPTAVTAVAHLALRIPRHTNGSHLLAMPGAGQLIGAAFRYEAYEISVDSDHPAAREAARRRKAGGSTPHFEHIPGRVEQRCMTAVDVDGGRYLASIDRIDESRPEAAEPKTAYLAFSDPNRDGLTGNVVDVTNRFLNAIKPVGAERR